MMAERAAGSCRRVSIRKPDSVATGGLAIDAVSYLPLSTDCSGKQLASRASCCGARREVPLQASRSAKRIEDGRSAEVDK